MLVWTLPMVTAQGSYIYYDWSIVHDSMQTGWCYRRKENFTFRYNALEDELVVPKSAPVIPQQQQQQQLQQQLQQ
jgi:hypothetical protein